MELITKSQASLINLQLNSTAEDLNLSAKSTHYELNQGLASQELSIQELNAKTYAILNIFHNDSEIEQDFRRICQLYESQSSSSNPSLSAAYQEYVSAYHKIASLYLFKASDNRGSLFIYDTENEREEVKLIKIPQEWHNVRAFATQIPNGELFCIGENFKNYFHRFIAFIIDRNYAIRVLPSKTNYQFTSAIYFDKSVYCFGSVKSLNDDIVLSRFNLDENRWINLVPMPYDWTSCHSLAFNRNILISGYNKNILHYSIDIKSFSSIPYDFSKHKKKHLIKSEERLYLIENSGFIYESDIMDEYAWTQITNSAITTEERCYCDYNQLLCSYNKGGIFISTIDRKCIREYYKFDLKQKSLIQNGYYDKYGAIRRIGSKIEAINCNNQIVELNFKNNDSLHNLGNQLGLIEMCTMKIESNPSATNNYNLKSNALYQMDRILEVIDCGSEAIKLDPYYSLAYVWKGLALYKLGRKREAIECYNQAIKLRSRDDINNDIATYIQIGKKNSYDDLGKKLETIEFCNESIMLDPDNAFIYIYKGNILLEFGKILEAIECYDEAIKLDPQDISAYENKGFALYKLGRNFEAIECYDNIIKLDPEDYWACCGKGEVLLDMERFPEAIDSYKAYIEFGYSYLLSYKNHEYSPDEFLRILEKIDAYNEAIKLDPCNAENYLQKGYGLHEIGKTLEEIECYSQAIKLNPENAIFYSKKGDALHKLVRNLEAIDCYNEVIKLEPNNSSIFNQKGLALLELDKKSEAVECYDQVIKLNPQFADAYFNKGNVLKSLSRYLEAIEYYSEAIKFNPEYGDAYFNKGCALMHLGRNLEAVECYDAALKAKHDMQACLIHKGCALHKLGKNLDAIECYDELIGDLKNDCNNPDIYIYKGNSLYDINKKPEAMECYSRAIEINSNSILEFCYSAKLLDYLGQETDALQKFNEAYQLMQAMQKNPITLIKRDLQENSLKRNINIQNKNLSQYCIELLQKLYNLQKRAVDTKEEFKSLKNAFQTNRELFKEIEDKEKMVKAKHMQILWAAVDSLSLIDDEIIRAIEQIEKEENELQEVAAAIVVKLQLSIQQ